MTWAWETCGAFFDIERTANPYLDQVHERKQPRRYFCSQLEEWNSNVSRTGFVKLSAQVIPISIPLLRVGINASLRCCAILENKKTLGTRLSLFQQWRKYRIAVLFLLVMTSRLVVQPDEDLHCIICSLPSKEPVLTRCGHRFCRQCLEEFLRRYS